MFSPKTKKQYSSYPLKIGTTKEGKKKLIQPVPDVIGEGSYGCVHRPSLRCSGPKKNIDYQNKVSKLGLDKHINTELDEYNTIKSVDKHADFYPGIPTDCKPSHDWVTLQAIDKCTGENKYEDPETKNIYYEKQFQSMYADDYKLLIMEDGGQNLEKFATTLNDRFLKNPDLKQEINQELDNFWLEAHRMFLGIEKFLEGGVVHHDIKHLNIVYNPRNNRINFIDFGLMESVDSIRQESKESDYGFAISHWTFPPECRFYNYTVSEPRTRETEEEKEERKKAMNYLKIAKAPLRTVIKTNSLRQNEMDLFMKELTDSESHMSYLFTLIDPDFPTLKQDSNVVKDRINEYYRLLFQVMLPNNYNAFLEKSITTIDSYGLGHALSYFLNHTYQFMDKNFVKDLRDLFYNMLNFNPMERLTIKEAISRYEDILENNGILRKYNKHFENHHLVSNDAGLTRVKAFLKKLKIPKTKVHAEMVESDPTPMCSPNKLFNRKTKRCESDSYKRSKTSSKTKKRKLGSRSKS